MLQATPAQAVGFKKVNISFAFYCDAEVCSTHLASLA